MLWVRISIRTRCTILCDKVCQWLATGRWFSPGPPVSSTNKTDRHDKAEILLKAALSTIKQAKKKQKKQTNKKTKKQNKKQKKTHTNKQTNKQTIKLDLWNEQWWWPIQTISINRKISAYLKILTTKRPWQLLIEVQAMTWKRYNKVAELYWLMEPKPLYLITGSPTAIQI